MQLNFQEIDFFIYCDRRTKCKNVWNPLKFLKITCFITCVLASFDSLSVKWTLWFFDMTSHFCGLVAVFCLTVIPNDIQRGAVLLTDAWAPSHPSSLYLASTQTAHDLSFKLAIEVGFVSNPRSSSQRICSLRENYFIYFQIIVTPHISKCHVFTLNKCHFFHTFSQIGFKIILVDGWSQFSSSSDMSTTNVAKHI